MTKEKTETEKKKKILILVANSKNTSQQQFQEQVRGIKEGFKRAKHREKFELEENFVVRPRDIYRAMLDDQFRIVHFLVRAASSQGREHDNESDRKFVPLSEDSSESEGIILEEETGQPKLVSEEALAAMFELFADKLECVLLDGCYSKKQTQEIAKYIPYVIGMKQAIGDKAAINFAIGFYDALGAGRSVKFAYKLGCATIQMAGIPKHLTPVLLKKTEGLTISNYP